jgi:hypothetical protein
MPFVYKVETIKGLRMHHEEHPEPGGAGKLTSASYLLEMLAMVFEIWTIFHALFGLTIFDPSKVPLPNSKISNHTRLKVRCPALARFIIRSDQEREYRNRSLGSG